MYSSDTVKWCSDAVRRIVPKVDMDRIADIVQGCEGLSGVQCEFYLTMLTERKEKILDYSLNLLQQQEQRQGFPEMTM